MCLVEWVGAPKPPAEPPEPRESHQVSRRVAAAVAVGVVAIAGLVIAGVVVLTHHAGHHQAAQPTPSSSTPTSAAPTRLPPVENHALETAGRTALRTWARPGLKYHAWWHDLTPLLSAGAQADYAATDPHQLPKLTLQADAKVIAGPSPDTATVWVETTAGRFGVDLTRQGATAPWRTIRFLFPGEKSTLS